MGEQLAKNGKMFANYLDTLVDRIFKILPLYEEDNVGLYKYIHSLKYELLGLQGVIEGLDVDAEYIILLATLESLSDDVLFLGEPEAVKREVFKCINITKRIRETTTESGDSIT